jgi:hypothetical protein
MPLTLLKANQARRVELAGVSGLVPRPVDIDQTLTGFETLQTLRIYRFEPPAVIDGHAEEDEVYLVVLAGSVELVVRSEHWADSATRFTLTAAGPQDRVACAAYLPPHAEYELTPLTAADVAYARARPLGSRPPFIFSSAPRLEADGVYELLDVPHHAERLRLRLLHIDARRKAADLTPIRVSDETGEGLVHVTTAPAQHAARIETATGSITALDSWDTIAVSPREHPTLRIAAGSSALALVVAAS